MESGGDAGKVGWNSPGLVVTLLTTLLSKDWKPKDTGPEDLKQQKDKNKINLIKKQ